MKIRTDYPVAYDSADHIHPLGTKQDNNTSAGLFNELETLQSRPRSLLDLGCAGGQFVVDAAARGYLAVGLEGSDYSLLHEWANWPKYHLENLFLCDISRPFTIQDDLGNPQRFDLITAWEVFEHIPADRLPQFLLNIANHLAPGGRVLASISWVVGCQWHVSAHLTSEEWDRLMGVHFEIFPYPFNNSPRDDSRHASRFVMLRPGITK